MEIGLIFALLAAASFGGANVFIRKGTFQTGESFTAVVIATVVGMLFFSLVLVFTAEWEKLWSLSWEGLIRLASGGIIHLVLGRLLSYQCIRLIGANKASAILRTSLLYSVILGIVILKEPLTIFLVFGVLSIATGVTLVSMEKGSEVTKMHGRGILAGLAGAFFWGISGVLIKPAIAEIGSPYAAAFVSSIAASLVMAGFLFGKGQREQFVQLRRQSLIPIVIGGIFTTVAQLFRYLALGYSPVSMVEPLIGTTGLFTFFLSFLLNRNIEVFTWKIFVGIAVIVAGAFLFFQ